MAWTDSQKKQAIDAYKAGNPTPDNSTELIKQIAEDMSLTPNGVRMVIIQAGEYVKKDATAPKAAGAAKDGAKTPRVSKEAQIDALKAAIEAKGLEVDDEILSKLTGKAAAYFTELLA